LNPNKEQEKLIESTQGTYLVDAGAGTGKTFSMTERYSRIVEDTDPENVFLGTFTRNAADEMSSRITSKVDYKASKIYNAPISTFHSHCQRILERHGFNTPKIIGIDEELENIQPLESKIREQQYFREFYENFRANNPEFQEFYILLDDASGLLNLLKSLASKGIIPREDEWFLNSRSYLEGDFEEYQNLFRKLNRPREGNSGKRQSILRQRLYSYNYKEFNEDAPDYSEIAGDKSCKKIRRDFCRKSFKENREKLFKFVHELYYGYLKHCLENNYLNFGFIMALAYVTLYSSEEVREEESFEYIMIDEFQDTNEIQLKIAMLLAEKPNICVVGDWKQSIYSFQYADINNIRKFQSRMNNIISELNSDEKRVNFEKIDVNEIQLEKNYRSDQKILQASEQAFTLKGNRYEQVSKPDITSLQSQTSKERSEVKKYLCEDEIENILAEVQELVDEGYDYSDIAVLSRTRSFGLEMMDKASEKNIPVAYEGGVELFNSEEGKILLAWLRALNDSRKGWAVILERTGYSLTQAEKILEEREEIPENLREFRDRLDKLDLEALIREVFNFYGFENVRTEKIIEILTEAYSESFMTRSDLIDFISENIEQNEIYEVDLSRNRDSVKVQTIHQAKGLEYPVVFISDVNYGVFPSKNRDSAPVIFDEIGGLRQRKVFDSDKGFVFDNWRYHILSKVIGGKYDEERRLMYVAMTRAEEKLLVTAEEDRESRFFEDLNLEMERLEGRPEEKEDQEKDKEPLEVEKPETDRSRFVSTSESAGLDEKELENTEKGDKLHEFAENYIENGKEPETEEEERIAEFIEGLEGEISSEVEFSLPEKGKVYTGRVDIIAETDSKVEIFDIKNSEELQESYEEQLEIYRKAFNQLYAEKEVKASLFKI
jgi:superfamily I DNA/RNA helicase